MLIQNANSMAQASPPVRLAGDGAPNIAVSNPSGTAAQAGVSLEQPKAAANPVAGQPPTAGQVREAVDNINRALKQTNRNLELSVDESTKKQMFKLKDSETGDVIRQYPTEEMLAISRAIDQVQQGLLLKQEA